MQVRLECIKGPEKGKVFTLDKATSCVAGRGIDNGFSFSEEDPYISRRHFLLEVAPPNVYFKDLDVTNPSRINNHEATEAKLKNGDIIEVGFTKLMVTLEIERKKKIVLCSKCKAEISVFEDENKVQICEQCVESAIVKKNKRISTFIIQDDEKIFCFDCKKDITSFANSDGRAKELLKKVEYICTGCHKKQNPIANLPTHFDDYEIIRKLGEGGMGKVFLARHEPTARIVALKVINIFNKELGARFNREMRIMKDLSHDNILHYIDKGQDKKTGKPYLVMEFAERGNLEDLLLKSEEKMPLKNAVQFIILSLQGLEHIHAKGVIHRDIKPENILLKSVVKNEGKALTPKVTDFGLAKEFAKAGGSQLTKVGTGMGTIFYMPPEQIRNAAGVNKTADIYSMGVTLYHLLSGKYPFDFPSPLEVKKFILEKKKAKTPAEALKLLIDIRKLQSPYHIVLSEKSIPLKQRSKLLPDSLCAVVDKSINTDPKQRYQSAKTFRNELEKAISV